MKYEDFDEVEMAKFGFKVFKVFASHFKVPTTQYEKGSSPDVDIALIINHLNKVTGSGYTTKGKKTSDLIKALLRDFSVEQITKVIDIKHKEWEGTDFEKFLRPSTLFGTKFEQYLNQQSSESGLEKANNLLAAMDKKNNERMDNAPETFKY